MLPSPIRSARLAGFLAAGLILAATAPALAQQDNKLQIQRPPATSADGPGTTYRLNPLEKQRVEDAAQKKQEEQAARVGAPAEPVNDPATALREDWWEAPTNGPSNKFVKKMIRNGVVRE